MSLIPPSPQLLSQYNSELAAWTKDTAQATETIAQMGVPQWVAKRPWLHNIAGPILTSMPLIMGGVAIVGTGILTTGHGLGGALLGGGLLGAAFSLLFVEVNNKRWNNGKFNWDAWQKDMDALCASVKTMGLFDTDVVRVVTQVLELRNEPINGNQKDYIEKIPLTLKTIVQAYKSANEKYIIAQVERSHTTSRDTSQNIVAVQPISILDNFGQGPVRKTGEHGKS